MKKDYKKRYTFMAKFYEPQYLEEFKEYQKEYVVQFPDLMDQGAYTQGQDFDEAVEMAKEVLAGVLINMIEEGEEIPEPKKASEIQPNEDDIKYNSKFFIFAIDVYIPYYEHRFDNLSRRTNCTLPNWMKELADANNLNYSQLLQKAIKDALGLEKQ